MIFNFWGFILDGVSSIFAFLLGLFPISGMTPNELLTSLPDFTAVVIVPFYFWASPIFELRLLGALFLAIGLLELVRSIIAVWRWILSLIPTAS